MNTSTSKTLNNAILKLLRPLVKILLRNGISFQIFADLARWVYTDVAFKEFGIGKKKQTISRVSIITGLSRKEVLRLRKLEEPADDNTHERYNRATRVISGWNRHPIYTDANKNPLVLPLNDGDISFATLVKKFSGDMPVRAVLDELLHIGAVEQQGNGTIKLQARAYLPYTDQHAKTNILGTDVADLITTIDHNLDLKNTPPRFQRKVAYNNIPVESINEFKQLSARESQVLLEKLDSWLATRDRDNNPEVKGTGHMRLGLGIFYFEEDLDNSLQQS